jgi:uracil-DNA glycosylase
VPLDSHHKIRYPNIAEKESGRKILEEEIRKFNPKFVYLFGKQVSDFLLKKVPVKKITNDEYIY